MVARVRSVVTLSSSTLDSLTMDISKSALNSLITHPSGRKSQSRAERLSHARCVKAIKSKRFTLSKTKIKK